jgi:hypothetical protein
MAKQKPKSDDAEQHPCPQCVCELADKILEFDECNPGEPESDVVIPFAVWEHWIELAGKAGFVTE